MQACHGLRGMGTTHPLRNGNGRMHAASHETCSGSGHALHWDMEPTSCQCAMWHSRAQKRSFPGHPKEAPCASLSPVLQHMVIKVRVEGQPHLLCNAQ